MPTYKRQRTTTIATRPSRRNYRKRYYRKKRKFARRIPLGMPSKKLVKLRYVDQIVLNPPSSGLTTHFFSANGMFDPDISGVGHQPRFFDTYMASFDHYMVIGSKIKVTQVPFVTEDAGDGQVPCMWGITLNDTNVQNDTTVPSLIEGNQSRGVWRMGNSFISAPHVGGRMPSLTKKFSAKKFLGDLSDKHEGSKSSNPSDQGFYGVWCGAPLDGVDVNNMAFTIQIDYIAILKEPTYIAQS